MTPNPKISPDAALGAILGALVGDAAGAPLEFLGRKPTAAEVKNALCMPGGGVWGVAPGQFTDDGELTLMLAHALANQTAYNVNRVAYCYRKWFLSSPFDVGHATTNALGSGDLNAPNLAEIVSDNARRKNVESKANGSLMRASPLGVWSTKVTVEEAIAAARQDALLTHPHPTCQWAGAAYVLAIRHLLQQEGDTQGAFMAAKNALSSEEAVEVKAWLDDARHGKLPDCYPQAGFVRIGFTYAFYHLLAQTPFEHAIAHTISGGGDVDTNACIVGGLLGALHGASSIPVPMRNAVVRCDTTQGRPRPDYLQANNIDTVVSLLLTDIS